MNDFHFMLVQIKLCEICTLFVDFSARTGTFTQELAGTGITWGAKLTFDTILFTFHFSIASSLLCSNFI